MRSLPKCISSEYLLIQIRTIVSVIITSDETPERIQRYLFDSVAIV